MLALIRAIHAELKGAYSPRAMRELRARGILCQQERVERLMRERRPRQTKPRALRAGATLSYCGWRGWVILIQQLDDAEYAAFVAQSKAQRRET